MTSIIINNRSHFRIYQPSRAVGKTGPGGYPQAGDKAYKAVCSRKIL